MVWVARPIPTAVQCNALVCIANIAGVRQQTGILLIIRSKWPKTVWGEALPHQIKLIFQDQMAFDPFPLPLFNEIT